MDCHAWIGTIEIYRSPSQGELGLFVSASIELLTFQFPLPSGSCCPWVSQVTLAPVCERDEDGSIELPDEDTDAVSLFRFNTVFTPFFFRNLTSFIAHEPLVDSNFVSALFGPKGSNRSTIIDLSLNLYLRSQNLVLFLLESYRYFRWEWEDPSDWIDVVDDRKYADYVTERLMSVEGMPDEEMNRIVSKVVELAAIKFSIFDLHCLSEAESFDFLPDVLNFKYTISTTPFTNLVKLKFTVFSNAEIALIFLTPLFPHLRHLTLDGYMYMTPHFEEDLKMSRYSITQRVHSFPSKSSLPLILALL